MRANANRRLRPSRQNDIRNIYENGAMIAEQHVLALPAGYQLGKYLFKGVLGSGGFGITYLAEDITLNRKVAVKEMVPNDFPTRIGGTTGVAKTETEKGNLAW